MEARFWLVGRLMIGGKVGCGNVVETLSGEMFHIVAMNEGREPKL